MTSMVIFTYSTAGNVVADDDPGDGWTYFPANVGIMYWNENMATPPVLIPSTQLAATQ